MKPRASAPGGLMTAALAWGACEPQDIYLFDPVSPSVDAGAGGSGGGGSGGSSGAAAPASPDDRTQPPCQSAACERCVADPMSCRAEAVLFCHPVSGDCVLTCDVDTEALGCPGEQVCHPDYGLCVECLVARDCVGVLQACDARVGKCVECIGPETCGAASPACDVVSQSCVECTPDQGCALPGLVCDTERFACVDCLSDADCSGEDRRCLQTESRCVECLSDADCTVELDKPFCSAELECEDAD